MSIDRTQVREFGRHPRIETIHRWLRGMLIANKAPYVITLAREVGYGLCKMAGEPRLIARVECHAAGAGTKSSARAHRGRANSNRACEAIWHGPLLRQRPGSRPTQPHRPDAATVGKSPWSDTYSFLSVTRGAPLAPSSHPLSDPVYDPRAVLDSMRRLAPQCEHRDRAAGFRRSRGRHGRSRTRS